MSGNIEDEIVSMQFDNKQFESGVTTSLSSLDRLKAALSFSGAGTGLTDISKSVAGFNMTPITTSIDGVNKGFLAMASVGITAIGTITNRVVNAGIDMAKSLTIDPIKEGFQNYETKINAVQTILANTASAGTTLKDVTHELNVLNTYANKTVYNFSEMAKNIGTFTAAGVDLKTSTESIKGIANLAALSGSSSADASRGMYQLSQAIAAGSVHLQDFNSVQTAGFGGAVFQKAMIQSAIAVGTLDKSSVHFGKTMAETTINGQAFRSSLTPPAGGTGWLTSKALTTGLSTFTGDLSKAQLIAKGFKPTVADAILSQAKLAVDAATKIKTFTQLFQALREEVATAYSSIFEALFGNINQAKAFLSPLHTLIENALTKPIYAIADAVKAWRKAGGFDDLITIFTNLGTIVGNLLYPFKELFGKILPSSKHAGKGLEGFTKLLANITGYLADATSVTHKFGTVLNPVQKGFGILAHLAGVFLSALKPLLPILDNFGSQIGNLFSQGSAFAGNLVDGWVQGLDPKALQKAAVTLANSWITWIKDALGIHSPATTMVPIGTNIVQGILQGITTGAGYLIHGLQVLVLGIGNTLKFLVANIDWNTVVHGINEGLFIAITLAFRNFINSFTGTVKAFQHVLHSVDGVFGQLSDNLKTMQNEVKSKIIRNIAISVGILAASAFLLSKVDGKKLAISLGAIAGMMATLLGVLSIVGGGKGKHISAKAVASQAASMVAISTALIAFATSVLILTAAVAIMGQLKASTIKKGLVGVSSVIGLIVTATAILSKSGGGATILATALAMTVLAGALVEFVGVMVLYSNIDMNTIVNGGGKAALVILALGLAMRGFGKGAIGGSVGLVIASAALVVLARAMQTFAAIGLGDMIKAVVALDIILGSLVAAAEGMQAAEGGAGSMLVMAAAIIVLAEALKIIASISAGNLFKAFIALAFTLGLIAGAAILLAPAVPLIAALGSAILLLGLAVLAAGVGVLAFATGMGILAVVGPAAFVALGDGIDQFIKKVPAIGRAFGAFFVNILTGIAQAAGPLLKAVIKIVGVLIDGLSALIPKGRKLMQKIINALFDLIVSNQVRGIRTILRFVFGMFKAFTDNLPRFIKLGTDLIVNVITGLGNAADRIANATGKAILHFINGLDKAVNKYESRILAAGAKLALDIVDGMTGGLLSYGIDKVKGAVEELANNIPGWAKKILGISSPSTVMRDEVGRWAAIGIADGIDQNSHHVRRASEDLAHTAFNAMKETFAKSKHGADALGDLQPKITPVLDLSQIEKGAGLISAKMGSHSVKAELSRSTARDIAGEHAARHHSGGNDQGGDTYEFIQNNYSPKPINHVKAYRGTKSQIALLKEVTGR